MIFDYRCPACNRCIDGKKDQEVRTAKAVPSKPPTACKHCKLPVALVPGEAIGGVATHYFTQAK